MSNFNRQRKTKNPCLVCGLHRDRCICAVIPHLDLPTKISLVVHAKELKRTTNTGRLAVHALVNSEMRVRGERENTLDLSDLLRPEYRTFLLYPSADAVELDTALVNASSLPIQLIVPDGNWRQAGKVHLRHKELKGVQRVQISTPNPAENHLRRETREEGMSTLEAIAKALHVVEGEHASLPLLRLYQAKLEQTLVGRGKLRR